MEVRSKFNGHMVSLKAPLLGRSGQNGTERVATLRVRCIPGHHINAKMDMERQEDISFLAF